MQFQLLHFETLDSTNREAADHARKGAAEGLTIVADEQTAGRARQGRGWVSEKGIGAYFSTILRPLIHPRHYTLIPLISAIAVYEALREGWSIQPDIKWPNDVLVGGKKICGILAEMIETPKGHAVVVGIGINLRHADPAMNATSIEAESGSDVRGDEVVAKVLDELAAAYDKLDANPPDVIDEWSKRSSYFESAQVTVDLGNGESYIGTTCGLEENGALRVRVDDGTIRTVQAGDVTRLRRL